MLGASLLFERPQHSVAYWQQSNDLVAVIGRPGAIDLLAINCKCYDFSRFCQ